MNARKFHVIKHHVVTCGCVQLAITEADPIFMIKVRTQDSSRAAKTVLSAVCSSFMILFTLQLYGNLCLQSNKSTLAKIGDKTPFITKVFDPFISQPSHNFHIKPHVMYTCRRLVTWIYICVDIALRACYTNGVMVGLS